MTIQSLYIKYKNGDLTDSKFLYEIRKKNYPFLHTNNSLKDVISILKQQKMVFEVKEKNPDIPSVECKTIDMVSPYEYSKGMNYELDLMYSSTGQNTPTVDETSKAQKKVLKNLTKDPYWYSRKLMTDEEKKYEKGNEREYELKKQTIHNNKKGIIREGWDISDSELWSKIERRDIQSAIERLGFTQEDLLHPEAWEQIQDEIDFNSEMNESIPSDELYNVRENECGCNHINEDSEIDRININIKDVASQLVKEWGLNKSDLEDEDILAELHEECNIRYKQKLNEMDDEGTIETDDEMKAKELADQGINVKLNKEQ